jgi:integrase
LKADLWRVLHVGDKPKHTFDEAALRWIKEMGHKRSLADDKLKMRRLRPFLQHLGVHQITADICHDVVNKAAPRVSHATKNRYLAWLRAVLNKAEKEWQWIDKAPHIGLQAESKRRIRWITPAEAQRLMDCLPTHLVPIVQFALATGLRKANVYGLRWDQIDMTRRTAWIHPDEAKAGRAIGVPLNQMAADAIRSQLGKHQDFVFTFRGRRLTGHGSGFDEACRKAGLENFRFHDLRHTWASWLIQSGVGLAELQELGGWESVEMVRRYAHLAPEHLHKHSRHIDGMMTNFRHTLEKSNNQRDAN